MFEFDIYDDTGAKVYAIWQYDFKKPLFVADQYAKINAIQFDNGVSQSIINVPDYQPGTKIAFAVPEEIISIAKPIKIYLYIRKSDGGYTVKRDVVPVLARKNANDFATQSGGFKLQGKFVVPSKQTVTIYPDDGFYGLSFLTVGNIPDQYIVPSGTLNVSGNGFYDVTNYEFIDVNLGGGSVLDVATTAELFDYLGIGVP